MRIERLQLTGVSARQHRIVNAVTALVTPQEELTCHIARHTCPPQHASTGPLTCYGRRTRLPRPQQTEDFICQHKQIAIEERDDRRENGRHTQMLKRMDQVREARDRHQQDRHLHRQPRADENADEAQQSRVCDGEVPHQKMKMKDGITGNGK